MAVITPVIPETITVHLGAPDAYAENVTVPFADYVKNVASSEIYPTWPENALRANIYAIISYALNRVYTEWYPSRGYDFDITNTTALDQAFVKNRDIYENISNIVDQIFNDYIVREGEIQPLAAKFCNGTTSVCSGLSQWGSVNLAEAGLSPLEILQNYYGEDIRIVENAPIEDVSESYPGTPLKLGDAGNSVRIFQQQLNRIGRNYPAIPYITITTGIFDNQTEEAVKKFQQIFNLPVTGQVDKATWYKIKDIYNGVKKLGELISEGLTFDEVTLQYPNELKEGDSGYPVATIQYYLNIIAYFNPNLNTSPIDSNFGPQTVNAVKEFQTEYGLPVTGIVDKATWDKIVSVYFNVLTSQPEGYQGRAAKLYPGYFLSLGARGDDVRDLQTYINAISSVNENIPPLNIDGFYGTQTQDAVYAIQNLFGIPATGSVGPVTWNAIATTYDEINAVP